MLTFSVNGIEGNTKYAEKVRITIDKNIRYFKKFNGERYSEAAQKAYMAALKHQKDEYEDLTPYIKKLARTILRVNEYEIPHSSVSDSGEVAYVFASLTEEIPMDSFHKVEELFEKFQELYLIDEVEFKKLDNLFKYDDVSDIQDKSQFEIRNDVLKSGFIALQQTYGPKLVYTALYDFFNDLDRMVKPRDEEQILEVNLREADFKYVSKLPDTPQIVDEYGKEYGINRVTLDMPVNIDYLKWDVNFSTNTNILKIDITPLIDYMYNEIFVSPGVTTKHITWCGSKYKLTTPGGYTTIGTDRNKFMSIVRAELIMNLLKHNVNRIVALSPDSIYLKPTRSTDISSVRCKTSTGKTIDLPVTVHLIKKRNR